MRSAMANCAATPTDSLLAELVVLSRAGKDCRFACRRRSRRARLLAESCCL